MRLSDVGLALIGAWLAVGESLAWWFSRSRLGRVTPADATASEAIVVLGSPSNPDGSPSLSQRYRCEIAERSRNPRAARSVVVFTGRTRGGPSEAAIMAHHAREAWGIADDDILVEEEAQNTWENIANTIPMIEGFDVIKIVSNPFHARRGRGYLHKQAPHLARRLRRAGDYRFGELAPVRLLLFWYLR